MWSSETSETSSDVLMLPSCFQSQTEAIYLHDELTDTRNFGAIYMMMNSKSSVQKSQECQYFPPASQRTWRINRKSFFISVVVAWREDDVTSSRTENRLSRSAKQESEEWWKYKVKITRVMARRWVVTNTQKRSGRLGSILASREIFIAATVINKFVSMVARYSNFHRFLWPQNNFSIPSSRSAFFSRYKSFLPAKMLQLMALFVQTTHSKVKKCVAFFKNNFSFADVHLANVWKFYIYGVWQARADFVFDASISMNLNNDGLLFFFHSPSFFPTLSLRTAHKHESDHLPCVLTKQIFSFSSRQ